MPKPSKTPMGKLMPIGGGLYSRLDKKTHKQRNNPDFPGDEILSVFLRESRFQDKASQIGILLSATEVPNKVEKKLRDVFEDLGNNDLHFFRIETPDEANDPKTLRKVEKLTGLFITGGDQAKICESVRDTEFHRLLKEKYEEDKFIIAGTSAGAMCLAQDMIRSGAAEEGMVKGEVDYMDGMGFINNVVIDTHFHERGRWGRLLQAVMLNSDYIGIGLAEDTALLIEKGKNGTVLGSGEMAVFELHNDSYSDIKDKRRGEPISVRNIMLHTYSRQQQYEIIR